MVAEKLAEDKNPTDNNLTISTKLSTDQLICKSPQTSSPEGSVRSGKQVIPLKDGGPMGKKHETPMALYFGVLQILFGLLMTVFGVLVLVHEANLSQIGGGLWGGCVATFTGLLGVLSTARDCCPLKKSPRRLVLTSFLALSLISLAVAHLTLALAAIGLARDANRTDKDSSDEQDEDSSTDSPDMLPHPYASILSGAGLVLVSVCECIAAAFSAWHCARALCPCFRQPNNLDEDGMYTVPPASLTPKDMLVSSWLGKHQQPVYVVAANRTKRMAPMVTPIYPIPTPPPSLLTSPVMRYPLIPAPLGPTPPPFIHPHPRHQPEKVHKKRRRMPSDRQLQQHHYKHSQPPKKQKKSREKQRTITEAEVAKTYTGLDRVIAEEFIEICDSSKITTDSDTSGFTSSETMSNEFVGERL